MKIRNVNSSDLIQIARIHAIELPNDFCSLLGENFLKKIFYPELLECSEIAVCAETGGRIAGYVFFSGDKYIYKRIARKHFKIFLILGFRKMFRFRFIKYVFEVIVLLFLLKNKIGEIELAYIAVSKEFQGRNTGSEITKHGLLALKQMGYKNCWVKTLTKTKSNVVFYQNLGFVIMKTFLGRTYFIKKL